MTRTRAVATSTRFFVLPVSVLLASSLLASSAWGQDLQPPPPIDPNPAPPASPQVVPAPGTPTSGATTVTNTDESKDSGLGLEWLWLNAEIGADYTSMDSINSSNFQLQRSASAGPAFGVGAGVRILFFTAGVRARDLQLSDFSLWEVDAEAAFHTRIDHVDPYFGLRGGYAFVGTLSSDAVQTGASDFTVHGFNAGLMFGLDYYFSHFVSLGVDGNPEFLFLQRPPVTLPAGVEMLLTPAQQTAYRQSGSSVGFGIAGTVHLGVHF